MAVVLDVQNLYGGYNSSSILKGISFQIRKGEFVSILGPNGSGKTTLVKAILGILQPRSSSVSINLGEDGLRKLSELTPKEIARRIAVVPQGFQFEFAFTVGEIVSMGRTPYLRRFQSETNEDIKAIEEAMAFTNTLHLRDRLVTELSGGERQRVIIAQALAQKPDILILDEPTTHLDISYQIEVMELLKKLNEEGVTIITVLHDLNLAAVYCERMILLKEGSVYVDGRVDEVLTGENIKEVFGVDVLIHSHPLTGKPYITSLPLISSALSSQKGNVHIICGSGTGSSLMHSLHEAGFMVTAGVLNVLDSDEVIAEKLGIDVVAEAPFSPVSEESFKNNLSLIDEAQFVVLTDISVGEGNFKNLVAAEKAVEKRKKVIILEKTPIETRDYVEGRAVKQIEKLYSKGALKAHSEEEVFKLINDLVGVENG